MEFFIAITIIILVGTFTYVIFFNRAAVVKRKIRKTPEKIISQVSDGELVKVFGKVTYHQTPIMAPLSKRACMYYHVLIEQHRQSGKHAQWVKLIDEEVGGPVLIQNGNDFVLIQTNNSKTHLIPDAKYSSGFRNDASDELKNYLAKHGYQSENWLGFNKTIRYKEGILEEGEWVAVVGHGTWKTKQELGLNISATRVLVIEPMEGQRVYLTDDPNVAVPGR